MQLEPVKLLLVESCLFSLLSLGIFQEEHSNEEVEEEEATNKDENDKEKHLACTVLFDWTIIYFGDVYGLVHDVGPALKRTDDEESYHSLTNIVEVWVKAKPLASSILTDPLGV